MLRHWASATYFCQIVETVLTGLIVFSAFIAPRLGANWFGRIESSFSRLAGKPRQTTIGTVAFIIVARLLLIPMMPVPRPSIHDEFSYLLAAKTFAAGRLTNVPHAFWQHFESVHILQQPTYMSMYQPGQGLTLAAGIWATGQAWSGVLVSVALLGGAIFWALSGWFPARWALVVTALAAIRWLLFSYWMNSYWGGSIPALGGALIFGSIPRLAQTARTRDALLCGLGLVLLVVTRPYEGFVMSLVSFGVLVVWSRQSGMLQRLYSPAVIAPLLGILALTGAALLHYNGRVTGHPLTLPYAQDRNEYAIAPLFIWGHIRPEPHYATTSLRKVYAAEAELYEKSRENLGVPELLRKLKNFWVFFLAPLLSVPFIAFWFAFRSSGALDEMRTRRYLRTILIVMLVAVVQTVWFYPHYFAPAFAPFLAVLLLGFKELRRWQWRGQQTGVFLSRAIPIGCLLMASIPASAHWLGWRLSFWPLQWALGSPPDIQGPEIKAALLAEGKKALVFVEYGNKHDPGSEWIYNDPDIQDSAIVWARSVNPNSDTALIRSFHDRSVWILRPDEHPAKLIRVYPPDSKTDEISRPSSIW